jgi:hypothetical protein
MVANLFGNNGRTMNALSASHRCRRFLGFRGNVEATIRTATMAGATRYPSERGRDMRKFDFPLLYKQSTSQFLTQSIRSFSSPAEGDGNKRQVVETKIKAETSELFSEKLLGQHTFEPNSYLDIDYFNKLVNEGLCKIIDENFCQDNRDYKYSGNQINHDKEVLLNQTLDIELVHKGYRDPVYYAVKNGEILADCARMRKSRNDHKGELIGRVDNSGHALERVVRVLNRYRDKYGYNIVNLGRSRKGRSQEKVGVIVLATFDRNRPHGLTVDHMNGIRDDDRLQNLRWATKSEQRVNQSQRSQVFPFSTMEETGYTYYQHPTHQHLFFSESSFFIVCWNDILKRFIRIYKWGRPILKETIDIDGTEYPLEQLIQEAQNNEKGVQIEHADLPSKCELFPCKTMDETGLTKRFHQIYQWGKRIFLKAINTGGTEYPLEQPIKEARNDKKSVGRTNLSSHLKDVDHALLRELMVPYKTMKETGLTFSQHPKYQQIYYATENASSIILCYNNNTKRFLRIIRWGNSNRIFSVNDQYKWKEITHRSTTTDHDSSTGDTKKS